MSGGSLSEAPAPGQDSTRRRQDEPSVNGYLLSLSALFAFGGRIADIAGHRRMLVIGVLVSLIWMPGGKAPELDD